MKLIAWIVFGDVFVLGVIVGIIICHVVIR